MPQPRAVSKPTPAAKRAKAAYEQIPRKTKEQDPDRYSKTPHEYGDVLIAGGKLGGPLQRDLIYWIERHTWGNAKRPEFAKMSITALAKLCQQWDTDAGRLKPAERKNVALALADLERRGIIEARDRKGCSKTTAKMYKLTPERWKAAKPYTPPTKKELAEAEAAIECEDEEEPIIPEATDSHECSVPDGKLSRPQSVFVRPSRNADPVTIRLVYNPSGFDFPVTFRCRPGQNGRIQVSATPHKTGEEKANRYGRARLQPQNFGVDNKRFTKFDVYANAISQKVWGIAVDDDLTRRIMEAAGAAPVELFEAIALKKLSGRDAGRKHSQGLLVSLAAEASRKHSKEEALAARQRAEEPAAYVPPPLTPEQLRELEEHEANYARAAAAEQLANSRKGGRK